MRGWLFLVSLMGLWPSLLWAQTFAGTVEKHEWNKSRDSFAAGGSDYYLLRLDEKTTHVLASKRDDIAPSLLTKQHEILSTLNGKKVTIDGEIITKSVTCPPLQQCLEGDQQVSWIRIKTIEQAQ